MKKFIFTLLFCLIATTCFAQEHWVYIRTYNRYGVTAEDDVGRSKKGDIVDIRPVGSDTKPSETAKKEWSIIKVRGLTKEDIQRYKEPWLEQVGIDVEGNPIYITKVYRRYKIDVKSLKLKVGCDTKAKKISKIKFYITQKTKLDLISYRWGQRWCAFWQPLRIFSNKIFPKAFAEVISTINKTGEDYDTLTLWEDAKDGDLVTETRQETAECYDDDGVLTDNVTIDGSTTNSSYYMKIYTPTAERHDGKWNTSRFILQSSTGWSQGVFYILDEYTRIDGLQIYNNIGEYIFSIYYYSISGESRVTDCILKGVAANERHGGLIVHSTGGTTGKFYFWNNIIYDMGDDENYYGISDDATGTDYTYAYNNTIHNSTYGIYQQFSRVVAKNNLCNGNAVDYSGSFYTGTTHNISEDTTAPLITTATTGTTTGTSTSKLIDSSANFTTTTKVGMRIKNTTDTTYTYITAVDSDTQLSINDDIFTASEGYEIYQAFVRTVTFEDEAGDDFHLDSTDTGAVDYGTDLSGDANLAFTDDIDGNTRSGTWDVGADEIIAPPVAVLQPIINIF